ncbi:MAG: hypothetical protein U0793_28590 [Gemmataceae bacterium]
MARRILNRKDLRADFDAAERRKEDEETDEEEGEEEEEDEDEEGGEEEEGAEEEESEGGDEDEEEEEKPKKKKAKPKAPPKAKPRTRTPKVVRMRVVWGVFSNNNQCVATYEYPKRKDADAHATRLSTEKRSTFFVQPVKEPIEEKKEK